MKSSELFRILKKDGWYVVRQKGSHIVMRHPAKTGLIIYPFHANHEIGKGLERKIKKDAGIL